MGIVFWWGNLSETHHLEDPGIRWEHNIKMDLQERGGGHGLDLSGSGQRQVAGCDNEPVGFIKLG